ncbi:hypothetical protein Syun_026832 [Stephania yunnanensis]|uniref:Uncharacterized protein n=1 Tax=Stephania yunnanensis TaxID=152371 RepID=A0AAP0HPL8_9MAGN
MSIIFLTINTSFNFQFNENDSGCENIRVMTLNGKLLLMVKASLNFQFYEK